MGFDSDWISREKHCQFAWRFNKISGMGFGFIEPAFFVVTAGSPKVLAEWPGTHLSDGALLYSARLSGCYGEIAGREPIDRGPGGLSRARGIFNFSKSGQDSVWHGVVAILCNRDRLNGEEGRQVS